VEIIAHRGASHAAPENTRAAVARAWEERADAVEVDVRLSADGRIVAIHDETVERTTDGRGRVAELSLDELKRLDAGRWKGAAWAGQQIPTLEEVLAIVPDEKRLLVEVKCGPEILGELRRVLAASGKPPGRVAVISFAFDPAVKEWALAPGKRDETPSNHVAARCLSPFFHGLGVPLYWVRETCPRRDPQTGRWVDRVEELIDACRRLGLDGLDVACDSELTREDVARIHEAGLELYVWTVDSADEARRWIDLGVDGITTNRPGWLREQLAVRG